jgi:hypothetical protein
MAARSKKDKAPSSGKKRKSSSSAKPKLKDVSATAGETSGDPLREGFEQLRAHVGEKFQQLRVEFQQLGVEIDELRAQERR